MAIFKVQGPFEVPIQRLAAGRVVTSKEGREFWGKHETLGDLVGCYVFAFRAAKGLKPMYVGKATKSFRQEVFSLDKTNKYTVALASQKKGTPLLFFVCLAKSKGPVNRTAIDEAETFLIQSGLIANKRLLNDKKTSVEAWSIGGLVRSGRGKASSAAKALAGCLKL
jgi:hypothetical protein